MRYPGQLISRVGCSAVILLFLLSPALAQNSEIHLENRTLLANVLDANGDPVRDLTPANFRLVVNGKQVAANNARYSMAPRRVVILLDVSGSMSDSPARGKWLVACEAAQDLLSLAPSGVQIAMLTFTDRIRDSFGFEQSRGVISEWVVDHARNGGAPASKKPIRTALFDAIGQALKLLEPYHAGDAIYAITDGGDNASLIAPEKQHSIIAKSGVRLFSFLLTDQYEAGYEQQMHEIDFPEIVRDSGGYLFLIGGQSWPNRNYPNNLADKDIQEKIRNTSHTLNAMINGFWTIDFSVPPLNKEGKIRLDVVDEKSKARKNLVINYPRHLFPLPQALTTSVPSAGHEP